MPPSLGAHRCDLLTYMWGFVEDDDGLPDLALQPFQAARSRRKARVNKEKGGV